MSCRQHGYPWPSLASSPYLQRQPPQVEEWASVSISGHVFPRQQQERSMSFQSKWLLLKEKGFLFSAGRSLFQACSSSTSCQRSPGTATLLIFIFIQLLIYLLKLLEYKQERLTKVYKIIFYLPIMEDCIEGCSIIKWTSVDEEIYCFFFKEKKLNFSLKRMKICLWMKLFYYICIYSYIFQRSENHF